MELHRLEFRGLGPFRGVQVIDFADLVASGLFLLEGPTGAGKSTIIDAIVFALYGDVAAATADRERLVSHFLTAREEPYSELVFSTNAGSFRIRRVPRHDVPTSGGAGSTTRSAKVTLTRLASPGDPGGDPISSRHEEVGAEVNRIVGLNKEQFIGTIVLPQGEFAAFLRADGRERRPILQRIFRTDTFEQLQNRLWEAKRAAEEQRAAAGHAVDVCVGSFHGAAGSSAEQGCWLGVASCDTPGLDQALSAALSELGEQAAAATRVADEAARRLDAARERKAAVDRRVQLRDRLREARARRDRLTAASAEHAQRLERLAAADRAQVLSDVLSAESVAAGQVALAEQVSADARAALHEDERDSDLTALITARDADQEAAVALRPVLELESGIAAREAQVLALAAGRAAAEESMARAQVALAGLPCQRVDLKLRRDEARAHQARLSSLEQEVAECAGRSVAAQGVARARAEHEDAQLRARAVLAEVDGAEGAAAELRSRYRDGLASELGASLRPGETCPVCGAREHPAPATPGADHVSRAQVDVAEGAARTLRARADELRLEVAQRARELDRVHGASGGLTPQDAALALQEARERLTTARAAADAIPALEAAHEQLDRTQATLEEQRTAGAVQAAALAADQAIRERLLAEDRAAVAAARLGYPTVLARVGALESRRDALAAAVAAQRALAERCARHTEARTALAAALVRQGFDDAEQARAARLPADERTVLVGAVTDHEREAAQVDGVLAEPELAGVDPDEVIDCAGAGCDVAAAHQASDAAAEVRGRAQGVLDAAREQAECVRAAAMSRDALVSATEPLIRVATLARGTNLLSMDLATYVLQRRFESVVAAANEHLRVMSDGQLQLVASDEAERYGRRAGLGLRIVDLRTDRERSPRTLSGGETFFTALSLALGLASVVTGEAGGVDLGTLFVDEGFGSLDSATLDDVLGVLTSLHSGGRTVGVVSHVEEMKARIPERIEVRRDDEGGHSTLTVVA